MAIVPQTAVAHSGNPTTSATATIPATVNDGDILILSVCNAGATGPGNTPTDTSGVGSWTQKGSGAGTAMGASVWYKRVTAQALERLATVTKAGQTDSTSLILTPYRGCLASGDPFDVSPVYENNASADNTHAQITTLTDGAFVCLDVAYSDNTAVTISQSTTSPGALTERLEVASTGGGDSGLAHASAEKATAGATGAFTWNPTTDQISVSAVYALKPEPVAPTSLIWADDVQTHGLIRR